MLQIKKGFRVFDEVYTNEKQAQEVYEDWSNKTTIEEVYVVGWKEDLETDVISLTNGMVITKTMENALKEKREWEE